SDAELGLRFVTLRQLRLVRQVLPRDVAGYFSDARKCTGGPGAGDAASATTAAWGKSPAQHEQRLWVRGAGVRPHRAPTAKRRGVCPLCANSAKLPRTPINSTNVGGKKRSALSKL